MLVAAADVGTPLLGSIGLPAAHDGAAAIVLTRGDGGRATIGDTASRFAAGDPRAAAVAIVDRLGEADAIYAPRSLGIDGTRALDERVPSTAPLAALRDVLRDRERAIVVTADASGQAGGVLVDARG
jgi:hypothetical protein